MYFRNKSIKDSNLLQLVESYRNDEGQPRQRIVASLGDATLPEGEEKAIAKAVQRRLQGLDDDWFTGEALSADAAAWVARVTQAAQQSKSAKQIVQPTVDGVILDKIETTDVVELGPQLVADAAWQALDLTATLQRLGLNASTIATAQLMIYNRLIHPLSEWALIDWTHGTALPEMLGIRITKSGKNRLYRTSDILYSHRIAIEKALRLHEADLFSSQRSIVLYDVTNTHFEGLCQKNPKAKHGKNKQRRNDCRQVAIGMAFDELGIPLVHDVYEGNTADTSTLEQTLDRLAGQLQGESGAASDSPTATAPKPIVILDAGFASKENIALLKERGYSYLINITRSSRTKYSEGFRSGDFTPIPGRSADESVEVKKIDDPDDDDSQLVLCRSAQRREKEVAMLSKAEQRFLADCEKLKNRIEAGRLKKVEAIERSIGRLQKQHKRVNRYYRLTHENDSLTIERLDEKYELASELCGDYVLKTDKSLEAVEIWQMYMTLLKAEAGFGMLKGSLGLRPNFHQLAERVEGHIFISILAYHLLCWIHRQLEQAGDTRQWQTIRRMLRTHSLVSTRLPTESGDVVTIRKPSQPDAEQQQVYQTLGIDWRSVIPTMKTIRKG